MARVTEKLTSLGLDRLRERPGMHADGNGLYLQVKRGGASWVLRYSLNGRARYMGLGPLALFGLADARAKALDARRLRHGGADPIEAKRQARARILLDAAKAITFKAAAEAYIKSHKAGWRNSKHGDQWTNTLATYAEPIMGALPVQAIDTALVVKTLEPIWAAKPETASRVRGRIEAVLDWANVRGYREGENPARWRGHLDKLLPARGKVRKVEHHAALPYSEIGDFIVAVRAQNGIAARALEFAILTAARTSEVIGARWREIDLAAKVWTVPAERMKAGREHRVPLSARALAILEEMKPHHRVTTKQDDGTALIFPSARVAKPLSNMAFLMLLRRMGRHDLTGHGFRSTFRDWAAERTNFQNHVVEIALAHTVGDKVEAAYRRGSLLDMRRRLMEAWGMFCATAPKQEAQGKVATFRRGD